MKKLLILIAFFLTPLIAFSAEKIVLNEEILKNLMNNSVPSIEKINMIIVQSNLERTQYNQKYSPFLNGELDHQGVDGEMYNGYNGGFSNPLNKAGININQNLPIGMNFNIGLYNGYQKTNTFFPGLAVPPYSQYDSNLEAKLTFDLWKNLLGYSEKSDRLGLKINEKEKLEQAKLEKTKFYNEIRKMYWNLSVNNSLVKVYQTLIKQAIIQQKNVKKMYKASVADKGDLARATAVINIRNADLLNVEYSIKRTTQELVNLIPELNGKNILFEFQNFDEIKTKISICLNKIKKEKETPFTLSSYTKLIGYKNEKIKANLQALKRYSDVDIKLEAKVASLGFGENNQNSFNDMGDIKRRDYGVALNVSVPFGTNYTNTKENQIKILKMQHNAEKKEIISNLISFHDYFSISLTKLFQVREQQMDYRENLLIRVGSMRKKYSQGRIALNDLIQDEDSLFQSELSIINTNYSIISLIIDYFSIFNETNCEFNIKL